MRDCAEALIAAAGERASDHASSCPAAAEHGVHEAYRRIVRLALSPPQLSSGRSGGQFRRGRWWRPGSFLGIVVLGVRGPDEGFVVRVRRIGIAARAASSEPAATEPGWLAARRCSV